MASQSKSKPYWASVPANEIADEILQRVDDYYKFLSLTGRLDLYRRSWLYYYRPRATGARLNPIGEQGELTSISINQYRNLLSHLETMTTQQRPAFEPRATNSDTKSQAQVILATGLLDYYMREKEMESYLKHATKDSLIFGEAFVRCQWDATSGEQYGVTDTGATVYEGDMKYSNHSPLNCIRDFTLESPRQEVWYILREAVNKYELAAKYPDLESDILDSSVDIMAYAARTTASAVGLQDSDNIFQYTLLHKPTPQLPGGRFTTCLDNGTVMQDGPIPYSETNVYRIAPDEETGTIFGYTVGFDLLSVQEALDSLYSVVVSNQTTFGVQNILVPKGHDLSTSQLAGGMNVVEYDRDIGKPEPMNLTSTPPEIFNFIQMLERVMETLSGVNSVARGNPESSLKSGAALALVQSMAIQFSQGLQQSYARLIENVGTGTINILKVFAAVPRVAQIAGKSNRPLMREFTGDDLGSINRVMVDMGNPLTRTTAGKVNLADALAERNMIDNPDQYIQVVTTGRLEPVIESKQSQNLLMKGENEMMADGKQVPVLITDNHVEHILEHGIIMNSPDARTSPDGSVAQVALAHISEHMGHLNDPQVLRLMAILYPNTKVAPPNPAPAPGPGGMPSPDGQGPGAAMNPQLPVQQQAADVKQPSMPAPPQGADPRSAELINGAQGAIPPPVAG